MMSSLREDFYNRIVPDFNEKMVRLKIVKEDVKCLKNNIVEFSELIEAGKKARIIFQEIAQRTQKNLEEHISNLVTLALKAVSSEFPNFIAEMTIRRNQLECDFWFEKKGNKVPPLFSSGGGPKDVASFALMVVYWSMGDKQGILLLDEPFRNVSPDLQGKVGEMLRMTCDELKFQLILVSHADTVNESADKQFAVELVNDTSYVAVI